MIDRIKKIIFVHIPKNAGESMEICLGGYGDKKKLCGIEKGANIATFKSLSIARKNRRSSF